MQPVAVVSCALVALLILKGANGLQRRCFVCRSRGELGTCRDPFPFNVTQADEEVGLKVAQCASGWCGKMMDGGKSDDYGVATERMCLQRGPSDSEERCAYTLWNHRKVYMCFCTGDMCNSARRGGVATAALGLSAALAAYNLLS